MVDEQHSHCFQGQCNNLPKAVPLQVLIRNVWFTTGDRSLLIQALAAHTTTSHNWHTTRIIQQCMFILVLKLSSDFDN